uniref:LITAF domain-containing protein n=1 Tax=Globodera rostochiensis TaxID=31243 RepID=A0A914I870_GLORO
MRTKVHVVVLGPKKIGKTLLLKSLMSQHESSPCTSAAPTDDRYVPTVEDTFHVQFTDVRLGEQSQRAMLILFHDTAGIANFGNIELRKPYLQVADAFLLVYSVLDPSALSRMEALKKYLEREKVGTSKERKEVPIVVVGTNCEMPGKKVATESALHWANKEKVRLFEVSARDRSSTVELVQHLSERLFHSLKDSKFSLSRKLKPEKSNAQIPENGPDRLNKCSPAHRPARLHNFERFNPNYNLHLLLLPTPPPTKRESAKLLFEEHPMELQKQPVLATKEQLRLAELTQTGNDVTTAHDDIALQKRVKKVIELTRCTQSQAEVALIDGEGNVEDAVSRLLDNPEELVLWSQQGKNKKPKVATSLVASEFKVGQGTHGRRADSQRGRPRQDGMGQQNSGNGGQKQYQPVHSRSSTRSTQPKEPNGPSEGPKTRSERQGFKGQVRTFTGGAFRRERGTKDQSTKPDATNNGNEGAHKGDVQGWTKEGGTGNVGWGDSKGWDDEKKGGDGGDSGFSTVEASYAADTPGQNKDDEWKNGPRVFMPSSTAATVTETSPNNTAKSTSHWPVLDNFAPSEAVETIQQKPKTFAAVAAAKKPQPTTMMPTPEELISTSPSIVFQKESSIPKVSDEPVVEWSSSIDWGNSMSPQPAADRSEFTQHPPDQSASTSTSNIVFGTVPVHSMGTNVNQEYTDQLKSAIGLMTGSQHQIGSGITHQPASASNSCELAADYIQQHNHLQHMALNNTMEMDQSREKFGFHFNSAKGNENSWGHQQHISSPDRSVLKNSTGTMLSTMTSIPTTSSSVSVHFNATSQQAQAIEAHQRISNGATRSGNPLSFSDPASVNFPPSAGQPGGGSVVGHVIPSSFAVQPSDPTPAAHQQQQLHPQNKQMYTPSANPTMITAPPTMQQHLQQQQQQAQTIFHQTSAATAVPQFPNYNMPYMYSPVAAAPALPAPNTELDRFLIQQYGPPYSQLDLQMGAMSIGPATTLAHNHHRATLDSYMENKFGQQQQNVNQAGNNGPYQQSQQSQQQRGLVQSEQTAALLGGPPSHVGPPPGFGMPTAPAQPSYVQPANIHSLFQMPTYPHPYQHPQYMMSNANRLQTAQRPAQTSPPEGNVSNQRRGGTDSQGRFAALWQPHLQPKISLLHVAFGATNDRQRNMSHTPPPPYPGDVTDAMKVPFAAQSHQHQGGIPVYPPPPTFGASNVHVTLPTNVPIVVRARTAPFGPFPIEMDCPYCRNHIVTHTQQIPGALPWVIMAVCFVLGFFLLFIPWCLCCLPFCIDSCLDVLHTCPSCKRLIGRFSRL